MYVPQTVEGNKAREELLSQAKSCTMFETGRNFIESAEVNREEAFEIYSLQPLHFPLFPQPPARKNPR